jgi:hypothetical protein
MTELSKKTYKSKLLENAMEFKYRYERYKINYSIAMGYSPYKFDLESMSSFIRSTDKVVIFNKNSCAIFIDYANDECGLKAANNLLSKFQGRIFDAILYSAVVTASNYPSADTMILDLFHLIDFAIVNNTNQQVIDHTQII